jgi:hypothetical protein
MTNSIQFEKAARPGSTDGIKALFFDVFGTLVDWRRGLAREAESILRPLGFHLDWQAFADAWRDQYQPGMEQVRSGAIPYAIGRLEGRTGGSRPNSRASSLGARFER